MSKEFKSYESKSISIKLDDVDEGSRTVVGYLSAFDKLDSDNDIIKSGAFSKSIKERGTESSSNRQIAHLRNHDWEHQIGKFTELYEDNFGLKFVSKLGRSTKGNDAFLDYQDGILNEHSIGFNYIQDKVNWVEDTSMANDGYFEITEVKLWEGSGVTFGANEFTPVLDVSKSVLESDYLLKLNNEMETLIGAIKNGKGTDDRLHNIEMRLKLIQTKYNSLIEQLEPKSVKQFTQNNEPNNEAELLEQERKQLFIKLINI
jgi:HK97 family phage prohead protease